MTPPPCHIPQASHSPEELPRSFEVDDILAGVRRKAQQLQEQLAEAEGITVPIHDCPIAPRELPPGTSVNGYTLTRVLGAGGFAVTYLATVDATGQEVVIKENFPQSLCYRESSSLYVLPEEPASIPACEAARAGFLREYRLLASLLHPHIPRAFDCFEAHNTAYYVMEYIDGVSLSALREDYAAHGCGVPQDEACATLVRLLDTLAYLHNQGLLHGDIKPENILITREGMPKLIDFGSAHNMSSQDTTYVVESPGFSPAELGRGHSWMGPWIDIYALGATFYNLLTGDTLPPGRQRELIDTATPLVEQHHLRAFYHPHLLASIDRATRPHAGERYQCVEAWVFALSC